MPSQSFGPTSRTIAGAIFLIFAIPSVGIGCRGKNSKHERVSEIIKMAGHGKGHGGKREGSGRPKGSRMRRSEALAEELIVAGRCPAEALVRLAVNRRIKRDQVAA